MLGWRHCSQLSTTVNSIVEPELGVTMLNNTVDNCEQCEQHNIVEFSERLTCLNIEWKLYTCRNSNREQLRKIHQL